MKKVRNKGFTTIELIFVLVILAMIIGIVVATYPGLTHSIKLKTDRSSAKNIANAVRSWYIDWNTDDNLEDKFAESIKGEPDGDSLFQKTVALTKIDELANYVDITGNKPTSLLNENKVVIPNQAFFVGFVDLGDDVRVVISVGAEEEDGVALTSIEPDAESEEIATYNGLEKGIIYIEPKK